MLLWKGDCLKLMKRIMPHSVDMILADLPYGTTQCKWDSIIDLGKLWDCYRFVLKPTGVICLTASQPFTSVLTCSNLKWFKHEWIWRKNRGSNFANTVREPMKEHESILVFSPGKWTYNKQMEERRGGGKGMGGQVQNRKVTHSDTRVIKASSTNTLTELRVPSSVQDFNCQVGLHPTQKPLPLFEYLIKTYTNSGDKVLDNCMGSGTTGVACKKLHRDFIGIELDHKFFQVASDRINNS